MFWKTTIWGAALLPALAAPIAAQEQRSGGEHDHGSVHADGGMPLLAGFGDWHHPITTTTPLAQQYFDQGLALIYAFNHDEAVRSFEEALRHDATCAMCQWGIAYALGPNINLPMEPELEPRALAAIGAAQRLAPEATALEQAYIETMAVRFGEPAGAARAARDSAFAVAAGRLAEEHRSDVDAQVIYADALLNLRPWDQWTRDGRPQPGTKDVVSTLEHAMRLDPNHAGACHLYVHTVEASATPELALACAERLPRLMPGAGHVVHMPAHVYLRVGRYHDAARANIAAVEADHRYFSERDVPAGIYPMFYAPHNLHFLWAAYLLSGQRAKALGAARTLGERVSPGEALEVAALQGFLPSTVLTHVRFGDWPAVIAEPAPRDDLRYAKAMWHYAQGMARSARAELAQATVELDSLRAIAAEVTDEMIIILNPAPALLALAADVLEGEIARRERRYDVAIERLREAVRREDALTYDEPPPWYHSARNMLGIVLLEADRFADAETVFREDLQRVRENGWSLAGLELALRQRDSTSAADEVAARLAEAWQYADSPALDTALSAVTGASNGVQVDSDAALANVRFGSVTLDTGVRLNYAETGSPGGDPVILLHGVTDSWFSFSRLLPLIPATVHVYALDQRGHGDSDRPESSYAPRDLAQDVVAFMKAKGIARATVVGHSMGSYVAHQVAVVAPARVARLVVIGSSTTPRAINDFAALDEQMQSLTDPIPMTFIREFQESTVHTAVPSAFMDRVIAESGKVPAHVWRTAFAGMGTTDAPTELSQHRIPTLILWGDRDAFMPRDEQDALIAQHGTAQLRIYPETGHAPHWERPEEVARDIAEFLQLEPPPGGDERPPVRPVSRWYRPVPWSAHAPGGGKSVIWPGCREPLPTQTSVLRAARASAP